MNIQNNSLPCRLLQLLEQLIASKTRQEEMAQTEIHLKTQLNIYTEKYAEFEGTLNKSNEVFATFKSEMEKVTKREL